MAFSCKYFGMSRSGYYKWLTATTSSRNLRQIELKNLIESCFERSGKTYGSPRVYNELLKLKFHISENTVAKYMREMNISAKIKRRFKVETTDSNHKGPIAPRIFKIEETKPHGPREIWAGDITYVPFGDKFLYLSVVLDVYNRKIVGWSLDDSLDTQGVLNAIKMAFQREGDKAKIIFHSDRGCQYASKEYRDFLGGKLAIPSMSRKGNCYDNSLVESFFKTFKSELIYRKRFENVSQLKSEIFYYIECWYNVNHLTSTHFQNH